MLKPKPPGPPIYPLPRVHTRALDMQHSTLARENYRRAALEVGYCADLERPRVITRKVVIPPAPMPSLEEYLASARSLEESTAELIAYAVRVNEEWERELAALLRTGP